ncbi:MAG: AraC family transcriptional regulator [Gemmatimonadota bacterium]
MSSPRDVPAHVGPARTAGPFTLRQIDYPAGQRQPPHSHHQTGLTILLSGTIREMTSRGEEFAQPLSVVVKAAGVRHADEVGPRGARTLQVSIDPEAAQRVGRGSLDGWRWFHDAGAAAPLVSLARRLAHGEARDPEVEESVLEAVAALDRRPGRRSSPPGWLARVREELDDRLEDGITIQALAGEVGVHPVSVSRAFREHYGWTVTEYRRRERVRRAAARIADARSDSLSRIAFATGHADHPHLCREFRRVAGVTPSEFRRLLR